MNTPWSHTPDSPRATRTPYAGPAAATSDARADAAATPQPYVPVELRTRPSLAATRSAPIVAPQADELPWISEYLAAPDVGVSPELPRALSGELPGVLSPNESGAAAFLEEPGRDQPSVAGSSANVEAVAEARADDWPFTEAAAETSELSGDLPAPDLFADTFAGDAAPEPLPMWNDDDMMDIMPVHSTHVASTDALFTTSDETQAAPHGAAHDAHSQERESAARALEGLANRVRGGELALHGYASEMGDAAALAAALAALLGERR